VGWRICAGRLYLGPVAHVHGIEWHGEGVVYRVDLAQADIVIKQHHLGHLALGLGVAPPLEVAHAAGLERMGVKNAPHRGFAGGRQPRKTGGVGMRGHVIGQRRQRPRFGFQPQVFRLTASQTGHPGLGRFTDLGCVRTVMPVLQSGCHAGRQGLVDAFVDRWARHAMQALDLGWQLAISVGQQNSGTLDFALSRRVRAGQFAQHGTLFVAE
jgi:hypothetical protein